MKLVKIVDVRLNQIWEDENFIYIIRGIQEEGYYCSSYKASKFTKDFKYIGSCYVKDGDDLPENERNLKKMIGYLGVTHETCLTELEEKKRYSEYQTDDIITFKDKKTDKVITDVVELVKDELIHTYCGYEIKFDEVLSKDGIYDVTHEFINENFTKYYRQ